METTLDTATRPYIELKSVIKEMVRTQVCFTNIRLLVDKVIIVTIDDFEDLSGNEAFLLLLTDGEKSIQGMNPRFHWRILTHRLSISSRQASHV